MTDTEHMARCQNAPCARHKHTQAEHKTRRAGIMTVPPPQERHRALGRGLTSSPMEVHDQGTVQNVTGRHPTPLLCAVTFPVH